MIWPAGKSQLQLQMQFLKEKLPTDEGSVIASLVKFDMCFLLVYVGALQCFV